ncbi:potassium transporter KefB [Spirosoma validum]|uniref:Potassium transporter KefB n=1 Tax=Spirosoma validum TaxID=2771355 RepID=A0A927B963_9BACT|nr:potassium transporter KefB [Spirosoma validum]MBD2757437.1 potassium transporter KefB [Spirosoma validum]
MTHRTNLTTQPIQPASLGKRMVVGAGIGLILIALFLSGVKDPNPAWGKLWMIRPLIIVPLAGAMGGLCNYFIIRFRNQVGVNKAIAVIVSGLVFIIGLWLGMVLGLDGTLWD